LLSDIVRNRPLLHQACKSENYAIAKLLLDKGVDVNYMTPDGRTALLMVLLNRNTVKESIKISMTTLLLKYKADPRKGSPPPLIAAVISQAPKVVKLLLDQKGVDVNCQDDSGRTPLSQAHIQRSANLGDLVNVLLPAYPDVNLSPKEPFEPIFHIVATRNVGWVQQVMGMHKFDVNVRNYRGETILHVLCRQRTDVDNTVVRVVLGHPHLDFSAQDSNGDTALHHFACDAHFYPIQNEIAARSRIDIPNNLGITVRLLPQAKLEKIQQLQNEYNMRRQSVQ
jgi:ankyrin repeat protein